MSEAIRNIVEIKKELEKCGSIREKVIRLNEITNCVITHGLDYIYLVYNYDPIHIVRGNGGCIFCGSGGTYTRFVTLRIKNYNKINYFSCSNCKDKTLCTYCLREKENCNLTTKKKITFILSSKKTFPKDIRKLITNLFFKN